MILWRNGYVSMTNRYTWCKWQNEKHEEEVLSRLQCSWINSCKCRQEQAALIFELNGASDRSDARIARLANLACGKPLDTLPAIKWRIAPNRFNVYGPHETEKAPWTAPSEIQWRRGCRFCALPHLRRSSSRDKWPTPFKTWHRPWNLHGRIWPQARRANR